MAIVERNEHSRDRSDVPDSLAAVSVRWARCFAVSIPLIVANCGWIANSEMKTNVTETTISTLFMGVIFILFVVALINLVVRKFLGERAALNHPEMMVVYTLLSVSSVVAGVGHFGFLMPFLANAFHYNTPSNGWKSFWFMLPPYIGPRDPEILKGFYEGRSTFFRPEVVAAWAGPVALWSGFLLVALWTTLCLSSILRRRWQEEEHLPFPVVALPLELTRPGAPLLRQRMLWIGFAIPLLLHSLNSLASVVPGVPTLRMNSQHDWVPDGQLAFPWTGCDTLFYMLHPVGVGFGFLVSTDVSFSLWFFYLLKKAINIWGVTQGWRDAGLGWNGDAVAQFPLTSYQGWGAWLGFGVMTLYAGRTYLAAYLKRAFRGDPQGIDRHEAMSARTAVVGFVAGYLAMCALIWSTGGSWWLPVVFLGIYIVIMVTLSRLRAETAVLCTELGWINPQNIIPAVAGTGSLQSMDMAHMGMMTWFNTDYRAAGMPHEIEGLAGLQRTGARLRPLVGAILCAAAIAMVAAAVWDLQMYYTTGAETAKVNQWRVLSKGNEAWNNLAGWIHNPVVVQPKIFAGIGAGFIITCLLSMLRMRFLSFPLHPAAYVLNTSFANDFFWCDMFVAWVIKALMVRYGGAAMLKKAQPFFLGLILGDFVTGSVWSIIGTVFHLDLFRTFAT